MSSPTKQSSPRAMAVLAALGLVVGLAIARLRLKLPKLLKGGWPWAKALNELVQLEKEKLPSDLLDRNTVVKRLHIVWQRLVNTGGQTCDRCGTTYDALRRATAKLKDALAPLGLEPTLETKEIDEESFKADPSVSNRIWIAGRPLEEWLGAKVGGSRCCSVCGDSECRTVEVGGTVFEAIPEELILKAALVAAAQMLGPSSEAVPTESEHGSGRPRCCESAP